MKRVLPVKIAPIVNDAEVGVFTAGFDSPELGPLGVAALSNVKRHRRRWLHSTALALVAAMLGHPHAASAQSTSGQTFGIDFTGLGGQGGSHTTGPVTSTWKGPNFWYDYGSNWDNGLVPDNGGTAIFTGGSPSAISVFGAWNPGSFYFGPSGNYEIHVGGQLSFTGAGIENDSNTNRPHLYADCGCHSLIIFTNNASAGNAYLIARTQGDQIAFIDDSTGGTSSIQLTNGSQLAVSTRSGALTIGDLSGNGIVFADNEFGGAQNQVLSVGSSDLSTEFDGVLENNSGGVTLGLNKIGRGRLTLGGVNFYTGPTTISRGGLALVRGGSIAQSSEVNLAGAGAAFEIGNTTAGASVKSLGGVGGSTVDLGAQTLTITQGSSSFSGVILGTGGLTVSGGTETLAGVNAYTGQTTITGGTLALSGGGSIANSNDVDLRASGARFDISNASNGASIRALDGVAGSTVELGTQTLTVADASMGEQIQSSFSGAIQGSGGLTVSAAGPYGFVFGAGTQTLGGINSYSGATTVVGSTLALSGDGSIANSSQIDLSTLATLDISGTHDGASITTLAGDYTTKVSLGSQTLTLTNGSTQFDGTIEGSGGLTLAHGELLLAGANTYTGVTMIDHGRLDLVGGTASIAGTSTLFLGNSDATFDISQTTNGASIGSLSSFGGSVELGTQTLTITNAQSGLFRGTISGAGGLRVASGNQTFAGSNTYQGGTVIDAGATLALGFGDTAGAGSIMGNVVDNGTFTFNRSTSFALPGTISGSGGVNQIGSGTTTLTAADTFTGQTTVSRGTLALSGNGSIASSNDVNLRAGTTFDISGTPSGTSITTLEGAAGATVGLGTQPLTITRGSTTFAGNIQGSGGLSVSGGTQTLAGANSYSGATTVSGGKLALSGSGSIAGSNRVNLGNPGAAFDISGTIDGSSITTLSGAAGSTVALGAKTLTLTKASNTFQGAIQGSGGLTLSGGTELLSGANSYTGATTINNGTLQLLQTGSIASSSKVDLANSKVAFDISRATAKAAIKSLAGVAGSRVDLGTQTLAITNGSTSFAGVIKGLGGLELSGGTQTLTGVNAYDGATNVSGGTLVLTGTGAIAGSKEVNLSGSRATFDIAGTANGASIQTLDGVGGATVSLGSKALAITNGSTTFAGAIQGPGGRLAIAKGTQILTGASTYSGGTSIAAKSALQLGNGGAGGSIAGDVADDGVLISDRSDSVQLSQVISGSGSLKKIGSGDLLLTGSNTYSGGTSLDTGSLILGSNAALGSGGLTMQAGTTLDAAAPGLAVANSITLAGHGTLDSGANPWQLAGNIGGAGGFTKQGTGSLSLTGRENYRGSTVIAAGTLVGAGADFGFANQSAFTLQSAGHLSLASSEQIGSLAGSGEVNIAGDRALIHGGNNQSTAFSGLLSGTGSFEKTGAGIFTFSGNGSGFTGQTNVKGGTLLVDGSLGSPSVSVSNGGALGGKGRIAGNVSVAAASLRGLEGQTLTMGGLTLSSLARTDVTLGAPGTMPLFDVVGNLTLDGTLNVADAGGFGAGVYRLINYGGALKDNGMVIGTAPDRGELAVQTAVATQVNLVNRGGQNLTFWDGGNTVNWNNGRVDGGSGIWDLTTEAWTGQNGAVDGRMTPQPAFAVFQGAPGQVTVSDRNGNVGVTGMQFFVNGYSVVGDPITLANPQTTIVVGDGTSASAGMSAVISAPLTGIGGVVKRDLGTLRLAGQNSYAGGTVIAAGTLAVSSDGGLGNSSGGLTFDGGTLQFGAGFSVNRAVALDDGGGTVDTNGFQAVLGGSIAGAGGFTKAGSGTLKLSAAASYSGPSFLNAGTLQGGIANAFSANSAYSLVSGATLDLANLDQTVGSLAGSGNLKVGSATLTAGGNNQSTAFGGGLAGKGGLTKVGTGTFTLTSNGSGFDGNTNVNVGTLLVDGSLGKGAVFVQAGAALGGKGTIGGRVSVSGTLKGIQGRTLTMGSLALASASQTNVALGAPGSASLFDVGGNLTLDGTLNVTDAGGFRAGVFRLFNYGGALTDKGLAIGTSPNPTNLAIQTAVARQVNLVNRAGQNLAFWNGGTAAASTNATVNGGAGTWDATTQGWTNENGAMAVNAQGAKPAFAVFQGAPGEVTVSDQSGGVGVSGMQFFVDGYHVAGAPVTLADAQTAIIVGDGSSSGAGMVATISAPLTGTGGLVKRDLGTLTLAGPNSYSGGTVVEAGTLTLTNGQAIGTGQLSLDGGTAIGLAGSFTLANAVSLAGDPIVDVAAGDAAVLSGSIGDTPGAAPGMLEKTGEGKLTLTGQNSYSGGTVVAAGTLVGSSVSLGRGGILDNAALVFDQEADGTFAAPISGSGALEKSGTGRLILTAMSALSGPTTVSVGTLVVDGSLVHSAATILSGGTLGGSGTVGALTAASGATVAPGAAVPFSTLNVAGNASFAPGSILAVHVGPGGKNDKLAVGGTATLAGGTVAVTPQSGVYKPLSRYALVSATGGVSGRFAGVTTPSDGPDSFAFLSPELLYDPANVTLGFTQTADFLTVAGTGNQAAVAKSLQLLGLGNPLYDAVIGQSRAGAEQAFNALSGEVHASAITAAFQDQDLIRAAILDRLSYAGPAGQPAAGGLDGQPPATSAGLSSATAPAFWTQAFGEEGRVDGNGDAGAMARSTRGFLIGGDVGGIDLFGGEARLGAAGGYLRDSIDVPDRNSTATAEQVFAAVYGGVSFGQVVTSLGAAYSHLNQDSSRQVLFPGFADGVSAAGDGWLGQLFGEMGYRFDLVDQAVGALPLDHAWLEPFVGGTIAYLHQDDFTEHGGPVALTGLAASPSVAFTMVGLRAEATFGEALSLPLTARAMVGWRHAYGDVSPTSSLAFQDGAPFTVSGAAIGRDAFVAEAGLDYAITAKNSVGLSYSGQFAGAATDHTFSALLKVEF